MRLRDRSLSATAVLFLFNWSTLVSRTNRQRALIAGQTLVDYAKRSKNDENDESSALIDLLTDLRHYCKANGIDFKKANQVAEGHFSAESFEHPEP